MLQKIIFFLFILGIACITNAADKLVLIYNGPGTSEISVQHSLRTFSKYCKNRCKVKTINLQTLKHSNWEKNTEIFIIPGGADRPYHHHLRGKLNSRIKKFVKSGGKYIGICAGAYYGSSSIVFAPDTPLEIIENRELKFFLGTAYGPALAPYHYNSNAGVRAASISTTIKDLKNLKLYYNGGCYFNTKNVDPKNFQIIARYSGLPSKPAAIILCKYGQGYALLSGVHFEYNPEFLDLSSPYLRTAYEDLKIFEKNRLKLVNHLMSF